MAKFVHTYHFLCGHTREEKMTPYERKKWESEGYTEHCINHEDHEHRCTECAHRYQEEQAWREVLEGEYASGLSPLMGDRVARYVRLREVQRIQQFWCNHSWFSPQTNQRLFQMYLDYIRLFPDAQFWLHHCKPEAQWKSKEFLAEQQLRVQFNGPLPSAERQTYELRYLSLQDAVVRRSIDFPFIEQWQAIRSELAPGESLVLSVRYYDDEIANQEPWTLEQDPWCYFIDSPIHLHLLWSVTPSQSYRLAKDPKHIRGRRKFLVTTTPEDWRILKIDLKPSWMSAGSLVTGPEKRGWTSWLAFSPHNSALRRYIKTTQILHLFQQTNSSRDSASS